MIAFILGIVVGWFGKKFYDANEDKIKGALKK